MLSLHGPDCPCRSGIACAREEGISDLSQERRERLWNIRWSPGWARSLACRWVSLSSFLFGPARKKRHITQHLLPLLRRIWFGVDRSLLSQGPTMDQLVLFLIFTVGLLLGFLLVPMFDLLGLVMVVGLCSLLLISWVCWRPR